MPIALAVDELAVRVERGVAALGHPALLLGAVARAAPARPRAERRVGGGEEEVERVLRPVVERVARDLRVHALVGVLALADVVRAPLALRVGGDDDVARLRERLRRPPVHLLGRLDRAVRDDDRRALGGAGLRRPDVAGDRRPVARGEEDGRDEAAAALLEVVEAHVARAALAEVPADVAHERALGVGRLDLRGRRGVLGAALLEVGLVLGRLVLLRALLALGGVRVLVLREGGSGERRRR